MPRAQRSPARPAQSTRAGFALLDVMLALVILALIAAIAFPGVRRPSGPLALRTTAYELSALLRNMRSAAVGGGHPVEARIERGESGMRVAAGAFAVEMPPDTAVALVDRRQPMVRFAPDGTSSGGTFLIQRAAARVTVAVNADTGAIDVAVP